MEYVIFRLCYGGDYCVAAVVYIAYEDVVQDALVLLFTLVSLLEISFKSYRLWYLHLYNKIVFLDFGGIIELFLCIIRNLGIHIFL